MVQGATRGDGKVGEEVTQNLKTIESIPLKIKNQNSKIKVPKILDVRAEVIMTKKVFAEINNQQEKKDLPKFANPRNVAAGSIRQLNSKITASRKLECYAFEIISNIGQETHHQVHELLKDFGFKISSHGLYCKNLSEVDSYLKKWEKGREKLDYQTDGVVIVINNINLQKKLGHIGKAERWMAAYKFPAEQAPTVEEDIKVQVGRVGTLTPVAILKPVRVAGSTVSRATLHNQDEINRLDVRLGDTVIIQKAGDIIPDIVKVLSKLRIGKEKKFTMPNMCPICNSPVVKREREVNHYCSNKKCFAQEKEKISHFVSKKAFNIEGLGPKIIESLINQGLITSVAGLFKLTEGDLKPLERFAERSAQNLVEAIQASKKIELAKFIYSLGIRHVGEETAISLSNYFGSLDKIKSASLEKLESIRDIGGVVAKSIYQFFQDEDSKKLLSELNNNIKILKVKNQNLNKLSGRTFVLTGSMESQTRDEAKDKIRKLGGQVSGSVSKKTDYLVAGSEPGSKFNKAEKLGVKIISEKEFLDILR